MSDIKEIKAYRCEKCGIAWTDEYLAEHHGCEDKLCDDCGLPMPKDRYYSVCESCLEKRKVKKHEEWFKKVNKVRESNYIKGKEDWELLYEFEDNFGDDYDEFCEELELRGFERPSYLHAVEKEIIGFDSEDLIFGLQEHDYGYEDYEVDGRQSEFIQKFVDEYNEKYASTSYLMRNDLVVVPDDVEINEVPK